jgi:hypothetical protein
MCKIAYKSCHRTEQEYRIPRLYYMPRMPTTMTITHIHDQKFYISIVIVEEISYLYRLLE